MKEIKTYPFPFNLPEKQYFILACFSEDLQLFYQQWVDQGRKIGRIQFFNEQDGVLTHKYWVPSKFCKISGDQLTAETMDVKAGYWYPNLWHPVRKDLLVEEKRQEALACQLIDCSCNDCKNFVRGFCEKPECTCSYVHVGNGAEGYCTKFKERRIGWVNLCSIQNQQCFEHRKI